MTANHTPKPWSPEYYEMLARGERAAARERRQTVESTRVHIANAEKYEAQAAAQRNGESGRTKGT